MSDDQTYADFLNRANNHKTGQVEQQAPSKGTDTLYLTSETDEPWLQFTAKSSRVSTAQQFADLLHQHGTARYVTTEDDPQYLDVVHSVLKLSSSAKQKDVMFVEVEDGTRIAVFAFTYDEGQQRYIGLKSKKVET